jgi:hypothetical protein
VRVRAVHSSSAAITSIFRLQELKMADDPKKTGLDRKLISLSEPHEVQSWTQSLGCTAEQLKEAVGAVGDSAEALRAYLKKK